MYSLYLFAACFLPLITFCPTRNDFQVGANLTTAKTLVSPDQPYKDTIEHQLPVNGTQLFARDVFQYTNESDYLEKREEYLELLEIIRNGFLHDRSILYSVGIIEPDCMATAIEAIDHDEEGRYAVTAAHCVHDRENPIPGIRFSAISFNFERDGKIEFQSLEIDSVITFPHWRQTGSPYEDIAVIHIANYKPAHWMSMRTTGELRVGREVKMLSSVKGGNNMMTRNRAFITEMGTDSTKFEVSTYFPRADISHLRLSGTPVYQGDDHGGVIHGVVSKFEKWVVAKDSKNIFSVAGITPDKLGEIRRLP